MSFLYDDPEKNWRYVHRFDRILTADTALLAEALQVHGQAGWGHNFSGIRDDVWSLVKALLWLGHCSIDQDLVLSFRGTDFTGEDLRAMYAATLPETEIAAHRDTGTRPNLPALAILAALLPRPFDPLLASYRAEGLA